MAEQAKFCKDESLNFTLLADTKGDITKLYGSKMPMINMSKRWTFIINPEMKIVFINRNVNADTDAQDVLKSLVSLKTQSPAK
ncbi:AhpC/TSA family protein [compost metagenome]